MNEPCITTRNARQVSLLTLKVLFPDYQAIENRFTQSIGLRFNVNLEHHPEVKQADLIALATEKRDLLPREPCDWDLLSGIKPLNKLTCQ